MKIALIVALAENNAIGFNNTMPWHLPEDLKYFKKITMGKSLIMGRKTHDSVGFALPGRFNIIISRSKSIDGIAGTVVASTPDEALFFAKQYAENRGQDEIMVIGGAQLYRHFLPQADRLYITRIYQTFKADAFFPDINLDEWRCTSEAHFQSTGELPLKYAFVIYDRAFA